MTPDRRGRYRYIEASEDEVVLGGRRIVVPSGTTLVIAPAGDPHKEAERAKKAARREARLAGENLWLQRYIPSVGDALLTVPLGEQDADIGGRGLHEKISVPAVLDDEVVISIQESDSTRSERLGVLLTEFFYQGGILLTDPNRVAEVVEGISHTVGVENLVQRYLHADLHAITRRLLMQRRVDGEYATQLSYRAQALYLLWLGENYIALG